MRIVKSTTLVTLLAAASIAVAPGLAFADNATSVINSGDHASVTSSTNQSSSVAVSNSNKASIDQAVNANANTGGNTSNKNIGGSSIVTGPANVSTMMGVNANTNVTNVSGSTAPAGFNATDVVNTGDHTHVNTSTNTSNAVNVANSNSAWVDQAVKANANTGWNDASKNIGGGSVVTGGANVGATMGVDVNHNTTGVGGFSGLSNGLMNDTRITNTGDHSSVNSSANSTSTVAVSNYNNAYIDQLVHGNANTGYNAANSNIGGGYVGTSGANVGAVMGVHANTNVTGVDGWLDGWVAGNNMNDVVNTGDGLHSHTSVNNDSSVGVSNTQWLSSSQFQWSHTNSGKNDSSNNIGGGLIGTSLANAGASFGVSGNTNLTGVGGMLGGLLSLVGVL